jgi:hypothetical protein
MANPAPTEYYGNVNVLPGLDTVTYGDGDLYISGNLSANGTLTSLSTTDTTITDGIVAVNYEPGVAGRDGGLWIGRNSADITSDSPAESGTAQGDGGGSNTIQLALAANASDDYYNGWHVSITGGTGAGQSQQITDYAGASKIATVAADWATLPDNTSVYDLFNTSAAAIIHDESLDEFSVVYTADPHTANPLAIQKYADLHVFNLTVDGTISGGGGGGAHRVAYPMVTQQLDVGNTSWVTVGYFPWLDSRYSTFTSGRLVYRVVVPGTRQLDIRVRDTTSAATLGSDLAVAASGWRSVAVSNPVGAAQIEIQVQRTAGAGGFPQVFGIMLEFDWP